MNTKRIRMGQWLSLVCACLFLVSCDQGTAPEDHLPKESVTVIKTNTKRIAMKLVADKITDLTFSDIFGSPSTTEAHTPADSLRIVINNPSEVGLDLFGDLYFVVNSRKEAHDRDFGILYFQLSDTEKFSTFLNQKLPQSYNWQPLGDKNNFRYGSLEGGRIIGWNENFGMLILPLSSEANVNTEAFFIELISLNSENSVTQNPNYQIFEAQSADLKIWMNATEADFSRINAKAGQAGIFLKSLESADYQHAYINFEDGKTVINNQTYVDEKSRADWEKLLKTESRPTVLNYFPENKITSFLNLKYNPKLITHLTEIFIQQSISQNPASALIFTGAGITPERLAKMFKGDILIASTGVTEIEQESITYEYDENFNRIPKKTQEIVQVPEILISMSADKKIETMLDTYRLAGLLQQEGNAYALSISGMQFYARHLQNNLLISNSLKAIQAVEGNSAKHRLANLASDYALSGYLNPIQIHQVLKGMTKATPPQALEQMTIKEILLHVKELKGEAVKSEVEILMQDEDENALVGLLKMLKTSSKNPS